jgi:negative regulator of flagellin synthesis FlgM
VASKINGLNSGPVTVGAGRVARTPQAPPGADSAQAAPSSGDVHITDSANRLASIEQMLQQLPAVDEARVAQVRSALADGTYTIQPEHIADQLLRLEKSLGHLPDAEQPANHTAD